MSNKSLMENDCIEKVISQYSDMIYRLAFSMMKTSANADDVYQEVFLKYIKVIKKGIDFNDEEHRKAWLIRVTINCCKSQFTSAWFRHTQSMDEYESNTTSIQSTENQSELKIDIHNAMQKLPQKYKAVVHLFYFEDLSIEKISSILELKPSTVRTQLTRARVMLKDLLKGDYFNG